MLEVGLGARAVLSAGGRGVVAATFAKAAYLRLPAGLVALVPPEVHSGPIHVRAAVPMDRLATGDRVTVDGRWVRAGPVSLDLAGATVWRGPLPSPAELAASAPLSLGLLDAGPPSALSAPEFRSRADQAAACVDGHDLRGALDALAGLGPGLTPAGDDVLAGVLLVERAWRGEAAEASLVDLAGEARTNDVARAFLTWAARGQSIEPVHRFLAATSGQDGVRARDALRSLSAVGHTSGADLALGVRLALRAVVAPVA